jgi:hypothetical protein
MATTAVAYNHTAVCGALLFMVKTTFGEECMAVTTELKNFYKDLENRKTKT